MKKAACELGVSRMAEDHVIQDDPGQLFSLQGLGCGVDLFSIAPGREEHKLDSQTVKCGWFSSRS